MSGTVIRSVVIEMGIRQLQATLTPPNVAAILDAQKAMEQTGESSIRAATVAGEAWEAFAVKIKEMQAALLETEDTFEKTLADAVAWEETLPGITHNTNDAAQASNKHAAAMGRQFMGMASMGRGAIMATRGLLFLMATDKAHQQQIIENLFLLQGMTDLVRGIGLEYRGWARAMKGVTLESIALKLANPEWLVLAAAIGAVAAAARLVYMEFTATGNAVRKMTEAVEHNADESSKMVEFLELESEHTVALAGKQDILRKASAELYTERIKLLDASQAAENLRFHDEAIKTGQKAVDIEKEQLHVHQLMVDAKRDELQHQIHLIDLKEQELRIDKEKDDLTRRRAADLFGGGPESRAKLGLVMQMTGGGKDLTKLPEHLLEFMRTVPDRNLSELARTEEARRWGASPLAAIVASAPIDPATTRELQIKSFDEQKVNLNKQIEEGKNQAEHLLTSIIDMMKKMQSRVNEIDNSARAKKGTGAYGLGPTP